MIHYEHIHLRLGNRTLFKDISLPLNAKKVMLLSGDNGTGKSTLLRIMAGLIKPDSGKLNSAGTITNLRHCQTTLLAQTMYLHQNPYLFTGTVMQNLRFAHTKHNNNGLHIIDQALEWVGLSHLANANALVLSGGERQRIALARAMIRRPSILLLDEPTAHLDMHSTEQIESLLGDLKSQTMSMVIASHEPRHFQKIVDNEYRIQNAQINLIAPKSSKRTTNNTLRIVSS